jgi:hypothetical protein
LKTHIKLPAPHDRLSPKLAISLPRKKSKIESRVHIIDSKEDKKKTCSKEMGGGDNEELQATITKVNIEKKPKVNLH